MPGENELIIYRLDKIEESLEKISKKMEENRDHLSAGIGANREIINKDLNDVKIKISTLEVRSTFLGSIGGFFGVIFVSIFQYFFKRP